MLKKASKIVVAMKTTTTTPTPSTKSNSRLGNCVRGRKRLRDWERRDREKKNWEKKM